MKVYKGFHMRIYPNQVQTSVILQTLGCCRWFYNRMLYEQMQRTQTSYIRYLSIDFMNAALSALQKQYPWLKEPEPTVFNAVNKSLNTAYKKFFTEQAQHPHFKRKDYEQSYTMKSSCNNIQSIDQHHILIPKLGSVYYRSGRMPRGRILSITIRSKPSGKFYAAVLCSCSEEVFPKTNLSIGIDVGLKDYAVLSNGMKYEPSRWDKQSQKQLSYWQKKASRRYLLAKEAIHKDPSLHLTDFKNYQKARKICAKIQEHISNQRRDYLDKLSINLIRNYDRIVIEDLKTKGMMQDHRLSRSIANASWTLFSRMLTYKSEWYGKHLYKVDASYTSQTCSLCGYHNHRLGYNKHEWLGIREWDCPQCGAHLDRDINAAINILHLA